MSQSELDLVVETELEFGVASQRVKLLTMSDALGSALRGLVAKTGKRARVIAKEAKLSEAMVSKLLTGYKPSARLDTLEKLRVAFGVNAWELFTPPEAFIDLGIALNRTREVAERRESDTKPERRRSSVDNTLDVVVTSSSPISAEGGSALLRHPDSELLAALLAYWDDMSPEARLELVGHGHRLRSASTAATPVGFKRA